VLGADAAAMPCHLKAALLRTGEGMVVSAGDSRFDVPEPVRAESPPRSWLPMRTIL
jgi:hypothetical protein